MRAPVGLYRLGLGRLLGRRLLLIEHRGQRSGRIHRTVLDIVEIADGVPVVAGGWGERPDWYRDVMANPTVRVTLGKREFDAEAVRLDAPEAARVLDGYRTRHPRAAHVIGRAIGVSLTSDPGRAAETLPLFRLTPIG